MAFNPPGPCYAVGKVRGLWHALGQGTPPRLIPIGRGRRRTFTPAQLAGACLFETALIARRAGRDAGLPRTFPLTSPSDETHRSK